MKLIDLLIVYRGVKVTLDVYTWDRVREVDHIRVFNGYKGDIPEKYYNYGVILIKDIKDGNDLLEIGISKIE